METQTAFQDQFPAGRRVCYGCGPDNEHGLQIKSYWEGDETVCRWRPQPHHLVSPGYVCGGVVATVMDCHSLVTAAADALRRQGLDTEEAIANAPLWVTRSLKVDFLQPTALGGELVLRARVIRIGTKSATVACSLYAGDVECARSELVGVRLG